MRLRGMLGALLAALLFQAPSADAGIGSLKQRWPQGHRISICFFGGTPDARSMIVKTAGEWIDGVGVSFDFGPAPEFNTCDQKRKFDVRVGFEPFGFWAFVGIDARNIPQSEPTINFRGLGESFDPSRRKTVLEEFGHVLGILHQEQDPQANCRAEFNLDHFRTLGMSEADIEKRYFPPVTGGNVVPNSGEYVSTGVDNRSIMRLFTQPEFFKGGEKSRCYGPPTNSLSELDLRLARLLYPLKPSDVSSSEARHLTVRLEGVLAAEHFGPLLAALHSAGKLELRVHVSLKPETITEVIAEKRLAPRGVTPRSLEDFLCRVNAHICTPSKARNIWSNTVATKNLLAQDVRCGTKSLPKSVICLPNVRLEPYTMVNVLSYDGKKGDLKQQVVNRHRGCEVWDERCRKLVTGLNRNQEKYFENTELLVAPEFAGELRIPARGYRLVVEYSDEKDRKAVENAISRAIDKRAQELQVDRDELAIRVTYPIGNPKTEISTVFSEPVSGYTTPLKVMVYPYDKKDRESELFTLASRVHVSIWDTRVDAKHCDLEDVVFNTLTDAPAGNPAPDRTEDCGLTRPSAYVPSRRYDHGTAVAGILSAKVNQKSIAGIVPRMKTWAWEVVDGNQFNAEDDPIALMLRDHEHLDPAIINISQRYQILVEGRPTNLQDLLFGTKHKPGMHKRYLFVVAAGMTEDQTRGQDVGVRIDIADWRCKTLPGCWSNGPEGPTRGLISVVALNAEGNGLLKDGSTPLSNHGLAFDVAAVGEVVTSMHGGYTGVARGSSVAAPYVSGLAALIYAKAKRDHLSPGVNEIKHRILFTADDLPAIAGLSRYGRINFSKALNLFEDRLRYASSSSVPCQGDACWRSVRIRRTPNVNLSVSGGTTESGEALPGGRIQISFKDLRSLRSEGQGLFTVIYATGDRLKRIFNAQIAPDDKEFVEIDNASYKFDVNGLEEFVSCSWYDHCPK